MRAGKRDLILAEAERLFGENGFAATRLSSIASAVGLGNAGVLHHFPSKAALYGAVLESIASDLEGSYRIDDTLEDEVAKLKQLIDGLLSLYRERPNAIAIIAHEFLDRSGRIEGAEFLPLAGVVRDTIAIIEAGQKAGTIRPGNATAMTAACHGAIIIGCLGRTIYRRTGVNYSAEDWESEIARSAMASVVA